MATKIYIYLASRSKKGIKLIATTNSNLQVNSVLKSSNDLNLPQNITKQIEMIINENKMLYQPFVETASSFMDLKSKLEKKGYTNIPHNPVPMLDIGSANLAQLDKKSYKLKNTMIRKAK